MTAPRLSESGTASLARDPWYAAHYHLGGRRGVLILSAIALAAALALNWSWLVAAGIAPVILTALPCLVMCGAGLCVNKFLGRSSCAAAATAPDQTANPSEKRSNSDA